MQWHDWWWPQSHTRFMLMMLFSPSLCMYLSILTRGRWGSTSTGVLIGVSIMQVQQLHRKHFWALPPLSVLYSLHADLCIWIYELLLAIEPCCLNYTVSQKTVQICFCQNFVTFLQILIIFDRKTAKRLKLCDVQLIFHLT